MPMKTVAVIDGNSLMHRAYHAVPPTMNAPDGTPTNAVFGFMSMFLKFAAEAEPDAIVCAFDAGKPKFRIEALEQYKAQRPPMDDELRVQFPLIERLLAAMEVPVVKVPGWEGDDILGTVAARDEERGWRTLLVTGDKDACQLASGLTHIVNTKKGISDILILDPAGVQEKYGVAPEQFPDFLGLMGDASDNIPGVPGIGPKGAAKLLAQFGSLEGIYDNLDKLKGKQLEHLEQNRDGAFLSRQIATIVRDLDFPLDLDAAAWPAYSAEAVQEAFGELGFTSHLSKALSFVGGAAQAFEFDFSAVLRGDAAASLAKAALVSGEAIGAACGAPAQASLFDSGFHVAFCAEGGCGVLEGDGARALLPRLVRHGRLAVLDAKAFLKFAYPSDSSADALVDDADVAAYAPFDASLAAYVLDSARTDFSAAALAEAYLGAGLPEAPDEDGALALAACVARALEAPLRKALDADGSREVYERIDAPLVPVLARMERTGAALDDARLARLGETTRGQLADLTERIYGLAGEEFNIDSPKQVGHILFDVIGLTPTKKTARGYSTDAKVLTRLSAEHELPGLILQYRELAKMESTYIDALPRLLMGDGRLHTTFHETVTATGRLSSSDPNLQNIPARTDFGRKVRACFVPLREGDVFLSADYSQIELRLLAHLSEDEHLIDAFNSGADFHAATAARVFDVPVGEVTSRLRSRAKAVNFGIVYGQQAFGLGQTLHIPMAEAQAMIDRYFEAYPGVRSYLDRVVEQAKRDGFASTMFGRKRHIPELKARNAQQRAFGERTAMNHPMQGSAADIIKLAMVEAQRRLDAEFPEAKLMLQVHDELDLSVPADAADAVGTMLAEVMQNVVELRVPLIVDVQSGPDWAAAH